MELNICNVSGAVGSRRVPPKRRDGVGVEMLPSCLLLADLLQRLNLLYSGRSEHPYLLRFVTGCSGGVYRRHALPIMRTEHIPGDVQYRSKVWNHTVAYVFFIDNSVSFHPNTKPFAPMESA